MGRKFPPPDIRQDAARWEADERVRLAAQDLLAACKAICEFWDFAKGEEPAMSTPLSPDALIGGHDGDDEITIHDVLRAAIAKAEGTQS